MKRNKRKLNMKIYPKNNKYKFRIKSKNIKPTYLIKCYKIFIIISLIILYKITDINNKNNINKKSKYFGCFCAMGRKENLYARELIEYYKTIGFDKFIINDNNLPNTEKFSDVL